VSTRCSGLLYLLLAKTEENPAGKLEGKLEEKASLQSMAEAYHPPRPLIRQVRVLRKGKGIRTAKETQKARVPPRGKVASPAWRDLMVQRPADQTTRRDMDLVGTYLTAAKAERTTLTSGILDPLLAPLVMLFGCTARRR
jgi:hypothetical protein